MNQPSPQPPPLDPEARQRTLRLSVREGLIWSIVWGFGEAYVQPFAIFLKAGPTILALLGNLPAFLGAAGQILGTTLMERLGRRRQLIVATTAIQGLMFLPLYFLPLLFPGPGAAWVLLVYGTGTLLFSAGGPLWTSLMGDVVPDDQRGRFFGMRSRFILMGMVVSMLLASLIVSRFSDWGLPWVGFGILFLTAGAARLTCSYLFSKHADPPMARHTLTSLHAPGWWGRLRRSPYAYFALVQTLLGGSFAIAAPFFGLYMLRDLQWSYIQFTTITVVFLLAQITVIKWWGHLCDRHGTRVVFQTTCLLLPLCHIAWFLTSDFRLLLAVQLISGALNAGFNLASANYMYDSVPSFHRARVVSYQSLVNSLVNLGAGLAGALLARRLPHEIQLPSLHIEMTSNLPVIFLAAGLLRLVLSIHLLPRVKEVRAVEPISSFDLMRRLALAEPLREQLGQLATLLTPRRTGKGKRESSDRSD